MTRLSTAVSTSRIALAAGVLACIWGSFWALFGLASGIGEGLDPLGILMHAIVPGGLFLAASLAAWRWKAAGGTLLIAGGLASLAFFPWARQADGFLLLPLPGIAAGTALLADALLRRGRPA